MAGPMRYDDGTLMWFIGEVHPIWGEVQMMGTTGGERYRWMVDEYGAVSMMPLDALQETEEK